MSMYYASFTYLDQNSADQGWMITHFEGDSDSGEMDTFLSTSTVGTDNYNGTKRTMYGSKYNNETTLKVTVIKNDGSDFGIVETREALKWLTGAQQNSWMYLYVGDEDRDSEDGDIGSKARFRVLGHVQDVKQYKMDARVVGLVIYFESASPWAYSLPQIIPVPDASKKGEDRGQRVDGSSIIEINNLSDDKYTYTPLNIWYKEIRLGSLKITELDPETEVPTGNIAEFTDLNENEEITINDNMVVTSSIPGRVFGNSFNFYFHRLKSGINKFLVEGWGRIELTYSYCIKLGDCVTQINAASDPICNDEGKIIIETLSWYRIVDTPKTLREYGLSGDAYNKAEIDLKLSNIQREPVSWDDLSFKPTDLKGYKLDDDVYTKEQIHDAFWTKGDVYTRGETNLQIQSALANLQVDEDELTQMLKKVLI